MRRGVPIDVASSIEYIRSASELTKQRRFATFRHEPLQPKVWHKRKHGFVLHVPREVHAGITVCRVSCSSMISNTCCTALLLQGAPCAAIACPP
jgi:hypothetical protein